MSETFDLLVYAAAHRYRVRNLHDGHPVPPTRPPRQGQRGRFAGCRSAGDREDAIIGRYGYVTDGGNGRLGWCLLMRSRRALTTRLRQLQALGVTVRQEGDTEAPSDAPVGQVESLLRVIRPYRRPVTPRFWGSHAKSRTLAGRGGPRVSRRPFRPWTREPLCLDSGGRDCDTMVGRRVVGRR